MKRLFVTSVAAQARLSRLRTHWEQVDSSATALIIGARAEAATEFTRTCGRSAFGWHRFSLSGAASAYARPLLQREGLTPASGLAREALWARVVFELAQENALGRFTDVADRPGLARALSNTVDELRLAGAAHEHVDDDLSRAWKAFERGLEELKLVDRATLLGVAARAAENAQPGHVLFLDVPLANLAEERFVSALCRRAASVGASLPRLDGRSAARWTRVLDRGPDVLAEPATSALSRVQQRIFTDEATPGALDETLELSSAPGETREAVEIVRRIVAAAKAGTPFDRIAVLLRSPAPYRAALEEAFRRADIPAHFAHGTRAPDAAGRALLALLACVEDGLSARRFAEYLSLAQVPKADDAGAPPAPIAVFAVPDEEVVALQPPVVEPPDDAENEPVTLDAPVALGALRTPRRWELLLVEAAVIGGTDRWRRRLEGYRKKLEHERASGQLSEANALRVERELADLHALSKFALPLLEVLAALPKKATWGEWVTCLSALCTQALKRPDRVLRILADLNAMSVVGPVTLTEVRAVLSGRLTELTVSPSARRHGHVFVAPIDEARGLSFDLVLIPGLAERMFPQKLREDPLLPDAARRAMNGRDGVDVSRHERERPPPTGALELETNDDRVAEERLRLSLALGAASKCAVLSYPRVEVEHARPRVPSFYALEVLRAAEGQLPSFEEISRRAETASNARLGWPAPKLPANALDDAEYDLAVLDGILRGNTPLTGRARYLVEVSATLARALRTRYQRWQHGKWTPADGLVKPSDVAKPALAAHQLSARAFSPTALELFAACPYKFLLSAIHRLSPLEFPEAIEELGPLEKGSLTHEVLFQLTSQLRNEGVRITPATIRHAQAVLDQHLEQVAKKFKDDFSPAIERVWLDGVETTRADLREWLRRVAEDGEWEPWRFELAFGLVTSEARDPASVETPVELDMGVRLRGSIDLVEKSVRNTLRATDYKTGKRRAADGNVVGGGRHLQPALYALVLEKLLPEKPTEEGRLYYCTQVGGFEAVPTKLDALTRRDVAKVIGAVSHSLQTGFFPAYPDKAKGGSGDECRYCDFRVVCGPDESRRVALKLKSVPAKKEVERLREIRELP